MSTPLKITRTYHSSATEYGPVALETTEASLIFRAAQKLRAHFNYNPRSHVNAYGVVDALPMPDPCEHEELCDFAEALVKLGDEFAQIYGYWGSAVRRADLVFSMGIEAYEAGLEAGRIEKAAYFVLAGLPGLDPQLDFFGTTDTGCICFTRRRNPGTVCEHMIAMKMLRRLRQPWNEKIETFKRPPATDHDEVPF